MRLLVWLLLSAISWAQPPSLAKVLQKFGHELEGQPSSQIFTVAHKFSGPADHLYNRCSQRVGLDLYPYRGQTGQLWKCNLKRRSRDGFLIYAMLLYRQNQLIGAWMCSDAPIAPGIASLGDQNFGKDF